MSANKAEDEHIVYSAPNVSTENWKQLKAYVQEWTAESKQVGFGGRFRKVPEGSKRFRKFPVCAGVGFGGWFRKVPESSGMCWCRFLTQVAEGSGEFRRVLVCRFRRQVPGGSGEFRQVPESSGEFWCVGPEAGSGRFRRVPEGSVEFRCVLV